MRRATAAAGVVIACGALAIACNLLIGIDPYHACNGAECTDSGVDGAGDGGQCSTDDAGRSTGCPTSSPVCSHGACAGITTLAKGGAAFHSCVVLTDKTVRCWGMNSEGQLGNDSAPTVPIEVAGLTGVVDVRVGASTSCALTSSGEVWCWGDGVATPTKIALASQASALSVGATSACAITTKGVFCWGDGTPGQLGCPPGADAGAMYSTPVALAPALPFVADKLAVGLHMACFSGGGSTTCLGDGLDGLGDGRYIPYFFECQTSQTGVLQEGSDGGIPIGASDELSASSDVTCTRASTRAFCWGGDDNGLILGDAPNNAKIVYATEIPSSAKEPATSVLEVSPAATHACAIITVQASTKHVVQCWGKADDDQLGAGSGPSPEIVPLASVLDIAAHNGFTCALQNDGQVMCWGRGGLTYKGTQYDLLANGGDASNQATPTPVIW